MKLAVICCLHGNEPYGLEVIKRLPDSFSFFIGNKRALKENRRFLETDLNRCFPGNKFGNHEERIACYLTKKLKKFDYVIDLHSTSKSCPIFGIITKLNKEKIELAKKMGLKRLVIMPEFFASGKAMIDYVKCGISLEVGPHNRPDNVKESLELIKNLIENKDCNSLEIYKVFKLIRKEFNEVLINNFDSIKKGQIISREGEKEQYAEEDFTAVLVNEETYEGILCLACEKVSYLTFQNLFKCPLSF